MARSLICWLAWAIEQGPYWDMGSDDALMSAPVLRSQRARRLNPTLQDAVAQAAASGEMARSGRKVVQQLRKYLWHGAQKIADSTANAMMATRVWRYCNQGRHEFAKHKVRIVSVSFDATRMDGKDTLYLNMYAPALQKAMWLPPQAGGDILNDVSNPVLQFVAVFFGHANFRNTQKTFAKRKHCLHVVA